MPSPRKILCLALAVSSLWAASARSEEVAIDRELPKLGDTSVRVTALFGDRFRQGQVPFLVEISNPTDKGRTWNLSIEETGSYRTLNHRTTRTLTVPSGSETAAEVLVPVAPEFASGYRNLSILLRTPGHEPVQGFLSPTHPAGNDSWPVLAINQNLARRSLTQLDEAKEKRKLGDGPFAQTYDTGRLPSDWRGYSSLDAFLIDDSDWQRLAPGAKSALLQWIRLGGRLDIYTDKETFDPGLGGIPESGPGPRTEFGLGEVRIQRWNGKELGGHVLNTYSPLGSENRSQHLETDYGHRWALLEAFGSKSFNLFLVFALLVAFALLVGPVNLFVFAKAERRHRLFLTTPLISLGAVALMAALIFFEDGFGGTGRRIAVIALHSGEDGRRYHLVQEQISRTGVMFRTGFRSDEALEIAPVKLPPSRWNPLDKQSGSLGTLTFSGEHFGGDFFRSRTEQGYQLRSVRPTRARLEWREGKGDAPPEVFSNLEHSLARVFVTGENDDFYASPPGERLDPGHRVRLEKISHQEFSEAIDKSVGLFSEHLAQSVSGLRGESGRFFALAAAPSDWLLDTHTALRWENDTALVIGRVETIDKTKTADLR